MTTLNKSNNKIVSVSEEIYLKLGNIDQYLWLYGENIENPILIFLHGGPGISLHGAFRHFHKNLEKHFLVIGWDQRGTGKSFNTSITPESLTLEKFISDLHELIQYLKNRFNKNKVYILGESWGSLLGITYTYKYPENIEVYIGTGQISDLQKSEDLGYKFMLKQAQKSNNTQALSQLLNIKQPPYSNFEDINILRNWLMEFGGCLYNQTSYDHLLKILSQNPESLPDFSGANISLKALHKELFNTNLFIQIPELKVPVYFLLGKHDYQVSAKLASLYLQKLKTPKKELIWFEKSGHNPMFEEPELFQKTLLQLKYSFTFRPLEEKHYRLFFEWVKKPHIAKWWQSGTYENFVEKYNKKILSESYCYPFIIYAKEKPIGYIQYYLADKADDGWWMNVHSQPAGTIGMDIIIGETNYIGKGLGTIIIQQFIEKIFKETNAPKIIIDPDTTNIAAIKCYEKLGFKKVKEIDSPSFFDSPPSKLMLMEKYKDS